MKVFDAYSAYYDLIYATKDYKAETAYVNALIRKYAPASFSVLELGCGTGLHASLLVQAGYEVDGIDQSETMLIRANERRAAMPAGMGDKLNFTKGDIRSYRTTRRYDAVASLFHVISYMCTDEDLTFSFLTASKHLKPGGIFIFDGWYGPAVLKDQPTSRKRHFENETIYVDRTSHPEMFPDKNVVDVKFDIKITDKTTGACSQLAETHSMRYLFTEEIANYCRQAGLELVHAEEWMSHKELSSDTWNACYVCRKKGE